MARYVNHVARGEARGGVHASTINCLLVLIFLLALMYICGRVGDAMRCLPLLAGSLPRFDFHGVESSDRPFLWVPKAPSLERDGSPEGLTVTAIFGRQDRVTMIHVGIVDHGVPRSCLFFFAGCAATL